MHHTTRRLLLGLLARLLARTTPQVQRYQYRAQPTCPAVEQRLATTPACPAQSSGRTSAPIRAAFVPPGSSARVLSYSSCACSLLYSLLCVYAGRQRHSRRAASSPPTAAFWPRLSASTSGSAARGRQEHTNHGRPPVLARYLGFCSCGRVGPEEGRGAPSAFVPTSPGPPTLNRARTTQPLALVPG